MFKILFNQNTSPCAEQDENINCMFVRYVEVNVNDTLKHRGYVYINQIYEALGVKWDPERENLCRIYDGSNDIEFHVRSVEDGLEITIE